MNCSLGIFAYNEEKNIGRILDAVLKQRLDKVVIGEIFVVASGCTDKTADIVKKFIKKDSRIKLLEQRRREGKASAVNLFLKSARNDVLVMESADTLPEKDAVENLAKLFFDPSVGMTGARPMPTNNPDTFMGLTAHLLWNIHHQISLKEPKMGEMAAFRKIFGEIAATAVDEAYIEAVIKRKGYKIIYVPGAIVYNKGPESVSDFIKQRRRIFCGHLRLKKQLGYEVSTINPVNLFILILKNFKFNLRFLLFAPMAIIMEGAARLLGYWDYKIIKRDHTVWEMAETTKKLD